MTDRSRHTPNRVVRVADDLWHAAQTVARERGETLSDIIRDALAEYVKRHKKGKP